MTDHEAALDRARELVAEGKRREAIDMLRMRVAQTPRSTDERRALATLYRELGHPDQAGRWGALVPDFTTASERKAFAGLLANTSVTQDQLRSILLVDKKQALPDEVEWAVRRAIPRSTKRPDVVVNAAWWLAGAGVTAAVLVTIVSLTSVYVRVLNDETDLAPTAWGVLFFVTLLLTLSAASTVVARVMRRGWLSSLIVFIVLIALIVAIGQIAHNL